MSRLYGNKKLNQNLKVKLETFFTFIEVEDENFECLKFGQDFLCLAFILFCLENFRKEPTRNKKFSWFDKLISNHALLITIKHTSLKPKSLREQSEIKVCEFIHKLLAPTHPKKILKKMSLLD